MPITRPITSPILRPLAAAVTEGVGGSAWAASLPALRTFVTANYDQPNPHNQAVMSSPPTITTLSGSTPPTGLTDAHLYVPGDAALSYYGGEDFTLSSIYRQFPVATIGVTGGSIGNGTQALAWRVSVVADAQKVSFRVRGQAASVGYRFIVDGRYASLSYTATATTSGSNFITLDFGTKASRTVTVESEQACAFVGVYVAPGDTVSAVTGEKRMILLTDSFGESLNVTCKGDGLGHVAGDMLGIQDFWSSGAAGTGYINNASTKFKLIDRIGDCNDNGPWDVIAVGMGFNDQASTPADVQTAADAVIASLRANSPSAQIMVLGLWDNWAPAVASATWKGIKAAIQAAVTARGGTGAGIYFLDTEGVEFAKYDGTHPTAAGHTTLGNWLALQIKTALGA